MQPFPNESIPGKPEIVPSANNSVSNRIGAGILICQVSAMQENYLIPSTSAR
jgi:hypothetical protein